MPAACKHHVVVTLVVCAILLSLQEANAQQYCTRTAYRPQAYTVSHTVSYHYTYGCWWRRCRGTRYRVSLYTAYRSQSDSTCCSGYGTSTCHALCFGVTYCPNGGTCTAPNTCHCGAGWSGSRCTTAVDCGSLPHPANGQINHNAGTTLGQVAIYSCNTGYDLVGDGTRTCQTTGTWSGSEPACQPVNCGLLPDPANGQVSSNGTVFQQTAIYSCNTSYNLVGDSTRTCQATGTWSGSEPTCQRPCQSNPCRNGGMCSTQDTTNYTCSCAAGFTGTNCSSDLNFCTPSTCLNGGTCIEGYGLATSCICAEGFNGTRCDIDVSFCGVDMCLNGGTCMEGFGTITTCDCVSGFTGANCNSDLNFCTPSTCLNGGTCIEGYGTETSCMCTKDFSGPKCATCISDPSSPMISGGGIVNESATVTMICEATGFPAPRIIWLKRNGTELTNLNFFIQIHSSRISITNSVATAWDSCELLSSSSLIIDSVTAEDNGVYVCELENGLPAKQINSTNISVIVHNECEAEPCQHGGVCTDLFQNVYCNCMETGYTGSFCQEQIETQRNETRPMILKSPDNTTKPLFETVNLTCTTDGYPPPVFKWYRDGLLIPNAVHSFYYIDQITPDLRGYYTCEAINSQDDVTSSPGLVTIPNNLIIHPSTLDVFQYLTDVEVNATINDDLVNEITSAIYSVQNENSTVRVYGINLIHTSNTTAQFLMTVVTKLRINEIQEALTQQLQSISSALRIGLPITVSYMERYDGCEAVDDPLNSNFPSISLSWPESNIGVTHSFPCPCLDNPGGDGSQLVVTRICRGNFISKASWQPVDYSQCGFTDITFKLCQTQLLLRTSPEQAAGNLANITSNTVQIRAVDVSVATSIIESLTTAAITNEKVREGYLETIDNLVQTDPAVIAMSQTNTLSSTRLLDSLTSFTDDLAIPNATSATFTQKTYALQVNDINTNNFNGQTFSVNVGSVQEAMSISRKIREEAIQEIEGNKRFLNRTASVQVPASIFEELGQNSGQERLSYAVFVRDTLFQSSDENQSNLTVGSIIVALRVNRTSTGMLSTPINVTFQASELVDNATSVLCSLWDPRANGAQGAWITGSCDQNHTSSGSTQTTQPPENAMGAESLTTLETTTVQTFTTRYSQPGHFGLLMDLTGTPLPRVYGVALQGVSYVGLVISFLCLTVFMITHLASRKLRKKEHDQILINLCLALMGMYLVFILGANSAPVPVLCGISAAFLQYFMLVFFSWTAVEAFYLYQKLVKVLGVREIPWLVLKIGLIVWVVPILIVLLCAGPGYKFYYQERKSGFCRSRDLPFYIGLIAPFVILYVFNLIMFVLIMISICKHSYRRRGITTEESTFTFVRKNAMIAFSLAILFGLGWGFGLAVSGTPSEEATFTLQLLFTIFVGCQGILIFVLHGVRKAEARNEWKKWFSKVTCQRSSGGVKSSSILPPSQHARSQVTSPSSSAYDVSTSSSLPNETYSEIYIESSTNAEKGEIPDNVEFNEQRALRKQSLIQTVADIVKFPREHAKYDVLKTSDSSPPQKKIDGVKEKDDSESQGEAWCTKQHTRRVSAPVPHSASSEFKQAHKHRMSLLTPISGKYALTSHDSFPICTESVSMSLLDCEVEEEEEERKEEEVEEEAKVRPQPHDTTAETAADNHPSATVKD